MTNMKLIIEIDDEIYSRIKGIHGKGSYYEEIIKNGTIVEPMKGTVSREVVLDVVRENAHHLDWQIMAINLLPNVEPLTEDTDRIECGTDGNPYKMSISNGSEFISTDTDLST